jgi:hypothetical protein
MADELLAVASASLRGGADGVVDALASVLESAAPFESGEVALEASGSWKRWSLRPGRLNVADDTLLQWLSQRDTVVSFEDLAEEPSGQSAQLPSRTALLGAGVRALLAYPLDSAGGARGAVVLCHGHAWAFAGESRHRAERAVALAGICLALLLERARPD